MSLFKLSPSEIRTQRAIPDTAGPGKQDISIMPCEFFHGRDQALNWGMTLGDSGQKIKGVCEEGCLMLDNKLIEVLQSYQSRRIGE